MDKRRLTRVVTGRLLAAILFLAPVSIAAAASPNVAVLAFGLFGAQSVFESEAKGAASIVAQKLGADPVIVRSNTKTRGDVSIATIADALRSAGGQMDHDKDILFVILTSHGSQAGVALQAGRRMETLSPPTLAGMLDSAGVRHRVVVVSECACRENRRGGPVGLDAPRRPGSRAPAGCSYGPGSSVAGWRSGPPRGASPE
jgi:hypothetical protein